MPCTNYKKNILHIFILLFFFLLLKSAGALEQQQEKSFAILPFQIHAAKDLIYLKNGIRDMLASRLAAGGGVRIVANSELKKAMAGSEMVPPGQLPIIGKTLEADYLLFGSFTSLGGGASLDAKVLNIQSNEHLDFYATAAKEDDVIMAINTLAWDIGEQILGRQRPAKPAQAQEAAPLTPAATPSYQTSHPDRAFMGTGSTLTSAFIRPLGITGPFGFSKSQNFAMAMQAMDVGDVDGDGVDDVVIASRTSISVYRRLNEQFVKIATLPVRGGYKIHYLSLADLNHNGKAEIYVSTNENTVPNSFAVEWQGEQLSYLFKDAPFFIRAMQIPTAGLVLAGQKGNMFSDSYATGSEENTFTPGIYQLEQNDGRLRTGMQIMAPESVNLFDFSFVDLEADGRMELVAISQSDSVKVLNQNGKQIWKSADYYGGTKRYVGEAEMERSTSQIKRYYIPSRIIVTDLNGDSKPDILVNKNLSTASRVFSNLKSYPDGEIHALAWNGIALSELWHTRKIDGYIADYQLRQLPNEPGKAILYVGVILSSGIDEIFSASKSTILMYPIDFSKDEI